MDLVLENRRIAFLWLINRSCVLYYVIPNPYPLDFTKDLKCLFITGGMPNRSEQVVITVVCSDDACASNWESLSSTGQNEVYIYWDTQSDCVLSCDLNWDLGLSWWKKVLNGLFSHRNLTHSFGNKRGSADDMRYIAWNKEWYYSHTGSSTCTYDMQKLKRLNSHKIAHQSIT
jgi:hypothetical protein